MAHASVSTSNQSNPPRPRPSKPPPHTSTHTANHIPHPTTARRRRRARRRSGANEQPAAAAAAVRPWRSPEGRAGGLFRTSSVARLLPTPLLLNWRALASIVTPHRYTSCRSTNKCQRTAAGQMRLNTCSCGRGRMALTGCRRRCLTPEKGTRRSCCRSAGKCTERENTR